MIFRNQNIVNPMYFRKFMPQGLIGVKEDAK